MATSSVVDAVVSGEPSKLLIQGFRAGGGHDAYVVLASFSEDGMSNLDVQLNPEDGHILSEEVRKQSEYSLGKEG